MNDGSDGANPSSVASDIAGLSVVRLGRDHAGAGYSWIAPTGVVQAFADPGDVVVGGQSVGDILDGLTDLVLVDLPATKVGRSEAPRR